MVFISVEFLPNCKGQDKKAILSDGLFYLVAGGPLHTLPPNLEWVTVRIAQ